MSRVAVFAPSVFRHRDLDAMLASLFSQKGVEMSIMLIANAPEVLPAMLPYSRRAIIHKSPYNIGVTRSWNLGCKWAFESGHDWAVFFADDFILGSDGEVAKIAAFVEKNRNGMYFFGHGHASFAISKYTYEQTGAFDEGFWPCGFEDFDYLRRNRTPSYQIPVAAKHIEGPNTRRGSWLEKLLLFTGPLNGMRFAAKWGGGSQKCSFKDAWGGLPPYVDGVKEIVERMGVLGPDYRLIPAVAERMGKR